MSDTKPAVKVVPVRLPEELHAELTAAADQKGKTLTATAVECIELALHGSPIEVVEAPEEEAKPDAPAIPDYQVDEFGVRIPKVDKNYKRRCSRCGIIRAVEFVPMGRTANERHYQHWCMWCKRQWAREIGR